MRAAAADRLAQKRAVITRGRLCGAIHNAIAAGVAADVLSEITGFTPEHIGVIVAMVDEAIAADDV